MEVEQLFEDFQYQDLQWFVPVLAGLVTVVGSILVALVRNFTAGVVVALLFGGLMTMSPVILDTLERRQASMAAALAENAAELAVLNSEVAQELSRVVVSLHSILAGVVPMLAVDAGEPSEPATRPFTRDLGDIEEQLDAAAEAVRRASALREELEGHISGLESDVPEGVSR